MKLFYKKVGDTFSLDEYNAMCYLLSKQEYSETFDFESFDVTGEYAEYTISDENNVLMENTTGYVVLDSNKSFQILINSYIPNASFFVKLSVYKNNTIIETDEVTSIIPSNELYEDSETNYEQVELQTVELQVTNNILTIKPSDIGLTKKDWISKTITFTGKYSEPIINWEDGIANTDEEIICETFSELEQIISSLPEKGFVKIRLRGNKTYLFDKEIVLQNKNVVITGGNDTNKSYAILDGQDLYRHFYVSAGSTLTIKSCHLTNGNGSTTYSYLDSPKRGGSILMNSNFINTEEGYKFNPSFVTIENCKFSNCHANRGGAICNIKGKLSCNNVDFENCVATKEGDTSPCWGGAILNESVTMYHDSSNQLYIDKSTTTFSEGVTLIDLKIGQTQNLKNFINSDYVIPTITCIQGNNKYQVSSVKTSQFNYLLTVQGTLDKTKTFYLKCSDFITRNLKIISENSTYYTIVVPDEVD